MDGDSNRDQSTGSREDAKFNNRKVERNINVSILVIGSSSFVDRYPAFKKFKLLISLCGCCILIVCSVPRDAEWI